MICAAEAQHDISVTLGTKNTQTSTPTWAHHRYACDYIYANGVMNLSVKQLSDATSTRHYFTSLAKLLVRRKTLSGLGQGAFTTASGNVVVSKDNKVLVVDVHALPSKFGVPPDTRGNVAISVAATIMGCWTGA